jgi:hypothetical protein
MLAKDLIAELQKLPADTEVCALNPKGIQSPWLLLRDYRRNGSHIIHIEGMGEQPRKYYIVQYGDDDDDDRLPGPCNGAFFE